MDKETLDQIKNKLQDEKKKIESQLRTMTKDTSFNKDKIQAKWSEVGDKDEDNAVEVANFQDSISIERDLEVGLERIDKALSRIDEGNYGKCEVCDNDISEDRLIAFPEATKCLKDASKK